MAFERKQHLRFRTGLLFQVFKYSVYSLLTLNIILFFLEDHAAALIKYTEGLTFALVLEGYATSIDTAAWVILLLVFELETYILDDRHFTNAVNGLLTAIRAFCFAFIVFAFYGYFQTMLASYELEPAPEIADLCSAADTGALYAIDESEYEAITSENCATFSESTSFKRFVDSEALTDDTMAIHIQRLVWADVINAGVWILIVILLEIDIRLQDRGRYEGAAFRTSMALKGVLYPALFVVAVYWGIKGDFIDFWDAFLWLVAFLFIENNILEWREEERAASA